MPEPGYTAPPKPAAGASLRFTAPRGSLNTTRDRSAASWTPVSTDRRTEEHRMKTYEFDVILKGVREISDATAGALFDAGCDDATPSSQGGLARVHFDREAPSLEDAIRSAVAQVQSAGLTVARVEMDAGSAVSPGT